MINVEKSTPGDQERSFRSRFGYLGIDRTQTPEVLELFLRHLEAEHGFSREKLQRLVTAQKQEVHIPLSVFSDRLSALETVVKYMSENLGMKNSAISRMLGRNLRTTWTTYRNTAKKSPGRFILSGHERFYIPASAIADRRFSTLETIVLHLKDSYDLSLREIALLLKRDDSTIWTVYHRAQKKALRKR